MKTPGRDMPKALLICLLVVLGLYLMVSIAAVAGVKADVPAWKVLADAGEGALVTASSYLPLSGLLVNLVIVGGLAVALAALNATVFSSSRVFYAMARQGRSLPAELGALHPRHGSPVFGIVASAILMVILVTILPIKDIAAIADLLFFFIFAQVHLAYIQFRRRYPDLPRPFKAPLYPWLSIATLCVFVVLSAQLVRFSPWALSFYLAWLILGMLIQRAYVERHESGQFARGKVVEFGQRVAEFGGYLVLLPVIFRMTQWREVLPLAANLAKQNKGELFVLIIGQDPFEETQENRLRQFYQQVVQEAAGLGVTHTVRAQTGADVADTVLLAVTKLDADLLLMPYEYLPRRARRVPSQVSREVVREDFARVLRESQCDLLIFNGLTGQPVNRAAIPVAASSHNGLLGRLVRGVAAGTAADVTLLHVSRHAEQEAEKWGPLVAELGLADKGDSFRKRWVVSDDVVGQLLRTASDYDLVLMSAKSRSTFAPVMLGPTASQILERCPKPVLVCYSHSELPNFVPLAKAIEAVKRQIGRVQRGLSTPSS
jgi:nucleotide-binding universal stress UspA family protein